MWGTRYWGRFWGLRYWGKHGSADLAITLPQRLDSRTVVLRRTDAATVRLRVKDIT